MTKEQAVVYLRFSGFSDEQIKAIEGAFTCEDCISALNRVMEYTYGMLTAEKAGLQHLIKSMLDDLPSVNPQKPICPSAGVDCEDCPAYEDAISRKAVLNTLENMDKALDEDRTVENYKELLRECYKVLPKKSEWQQDHEILKAYSNGANDMLDKIKAEMANHLQTMDICNVEKANGVIVQSELTNRKVVLYDTVLHIIDEYKAEGSDQE